MDNHVLRDLVSQIRAWTLLLVDQLNELQIGGLGQDIEMNEISFPSKTLDNGVLWVRLVEDVRRFSSSAV